jgi:hypothetical protein
VLVLVMSKQHLEKVIEDRAVTYALGLNYLHMKLNAIGSRGKPDQLFVSPAGVTIYIEFKRFGEEPSGLQEYWARELCKRKQIVYGCQLWEHAQAILQNHLDPAALPIEGIATYDGSRLRWTIPRSWSRKNVHLPDGFQDP